MFVIATQTTIIAYDVAGIWARCQLHSRCPQVALFDYNKYVTGP
jgi:hypothetical protein